MFRNYLLTKPCSYYDHTSLLLHLTVCDGFNTHYLLYSLSHERFDNIVKLDWPKLQGLGVPHLEPDVQPGDEKDDGGLFPEHDYGFEISHPVSFDGTLCLESKIYTKNRVVLWNPTTKEFKLIPLPEKNLTENVLTHHYQVGYDHLKDDYKMIRCTHYSPERVFLNNVFFWEMYSLRSNSWKKIDVNMPHSWNEEPVYMDGVSHGWHITETSVYLLSFDFCKESFITTPIPSHEDDSFDFYLVHRHFMVLNGSIAFMVNNTQTSTFHISILGELGVMESWTKLFIVGPLPCLDHFVGAGKRGNILFRKKDSELAWFDLNTGMIDEIGITTQRLHCKILFYKENSLPIGGIYTNFSSCYHP